MDKTPSSWRLDVIFGDDASRIRKGHAPAIMTAIRHLCLNLFEQELSKLRMSQKRRKTAWNDDYRAKVVFGQRTVINARSPWPKQLDSRSQIRNFAIADITASSSNLQVRLGEIEIYS